MPKTVEPIICPNPKCQKKIEELTIVSDTSTTPAEQYYACPHCLVKLDWISAQLKTEQQEKEEPLVKPPEMEEKVSKGEESPKGCPHHFGYLASRTEDAPIARECLACPKVLDCVMKK